MAARPTILPKAAEGRTGLLWHARLVDIGWRKDQLMPASLYDRLVALPRPELGKPAMPPVEIIAFNVHVRRKLHGWKQSTLASLADVSLSTIERIERGEAVQPALMEKVGASVRLSAGLLHRPPAPADARGDSAAVRRPHCISVGRTIRQAGAVSSHRTMPASCVCADRRLPQRPASAAQVVRTTV
ncbi:helix-turn-helix transcriptional regulator [Caulobacter segnis]